MSDIINISSNSSDDEVSDIINISSNSSDDEVEVVEVRRSGRKRKSTTIKIGGHIVKRQNNYSVTADSYVMGTYEEPTETKKPAAAKPKAKPNNAPKQPRKQSAAEVARLKHNEEVKKSAKNKELVRRSFLVKHYDVIEPFMDEATRAKVKEWSKEKAVKAVQYHRNDVFVQPDLVTGGEMRDYQLTGLNFMLDLHRQNLGMILGDEMGLGKTLQTISLLSHLKQHDEKCGPSLVVCPLSVLYSWCNELKKWAPSLRVLRVHGSGTDSQIDQKKELQEHAAENYDVIVTTYDMIKVTELRAAWTRIYFRYLVLDEGHIIKAGITQIAQAVRKLHCENRLLLTGTPLQNNLTELVSLLNFLLPDIVNNYEPFQDAFDITNNRIDKEKMIQAQKILDLFMLRRLKDRVEKLMPKKIETKVYCPLSKKQVHWYKSLLMKDIQLLARVDEKHGDGNEAPQRKSVLNSLFAQLRKACIHPFLFDGAEADINATSLEDLIGASGKLAVLDMLLRSLFQKGHRCVLFSQFTSVLDILSDYCTMRGWNHFCFDGRTSRAKRNYYVNAFNAPDSPCFLFLMSTRSGSMGLNLQSADTCILFDMDMNPQMDIQAQARVHRIGQTKTVHVYRLVTAGTIEERILQRAEKKLLLDQMVNRERTDSTKKVKEDSGLSESEMLRDIKFGCAAVFGDSSVNSLPTAKDIAFITDRKRSEMDSEGKLKGNVFHNAATFDVSQKLNETQVFGGVDFRKLREERTKSKAQLPTSIRSIADAWIAMPNADEKRKKKSRILMVDGMKSGYGSALVPVLASNNYELNLGESSVFDRELNAAARNSAKVMGRKQKQKFETQSYCQVCGDGGTLFCCSRCPGAAHERCFAPIKTRGSCSHHWCSRCGKGPSAAGGILFPCMSCPNSFCEDCLPKDEPGFQFIGKNEYLEELGYNSTNMSIYIFCSQQCDSWAKKELGWKPKRNRKGICPEPLDVESHFVSGTDSDSEDEVIVLDSPPAVASTSASSSSDSGSVEILDI